MDGLEPYTGYEDYNSGMSDYDQAYSSDPAKKKTSYSDADDKAAILTIAAAVTEPRRYEEIVLSPEKYDDKKTVRSASLNKYDRAPLVAVCPESKRVSLHPLGNIVKPPGVTDSSWQLLDADNLFRKDYSPYIYDTDGVAVAVQSVSGTKLPMSASGGGGDTAGITEEEHDSSEMPFLDHLEEFRWALLKSIFAVVITMMSSWFLSDYFYTTITSLAKNAKLELISTKVMEPIMLKLQMALVMGVVLALPFLFYFLWSFISPGLYKREKKWILPLVFGATGCFFIGASIAYFLVIPSVLPLISAFLPPNIKQMITIGDFVSNMLKFTILFGVMFEMPLVTFFLAKVGIIKHQWMSKYRKYAIIVIFIAGAVLTPPDPVSQIMMAIPLLLLYEISVIVARFAGKNPILKY